MLRQLAVSIATLIALSHSALARAEAWFEVEVYVFERQSQSSEQWPMAPIEGKTNGSVDLITPIFGQAVASMGSTAGNGSDSAPCTLVYDSDANSHCAETSDSANASPFGSSSTMSYRYPGAIPSEIGSGSKSYAAAGKGPVLLSSSQGQFANIINSLARDRGNHSLLHMTWQQPMSGKSSSVPMHLFAGKDFSKSYHYDGRQISQQTLSDGATEPSQDSPVWQLDGTLNIYLNNYLYIETALNLRKEGRKLLPVDNDGTNITTTTPQKVMTPYLMSVPLEQNRRVKSDEIHYLDHPEMGMVIQIRKMAQPGA